MTAWVIRHKGITAVVAALVALFAIGIAVGGSHHKSTAENAPITAHSIQPLAGLSSQSPDSVTAEDSRSAAEAIAAEASQAAASLSAASQAAVSRAAASRVAAASRAAASQAAASRAAAAAASSQASGPADPPPASANCTPGYDPCIPPGPDADCAGGKGNGPRYVTGPIRVTGSDPYGLDSDHDGMACEK